MALDALDPGPNGDYPYLPRNPDGTLDTKLMPIGTTIQNGVLIDLEPTLPDGRRVTDVVPAPQGG